MFEQIMYMNLDNQRYLGIICYDRVYGKIAVSHMQWRISLLDNQIIRLKLKKTP